jgi:hypothetical protein
LVSELLERLKGTPGLGVPGDAPVLPHQFLVGCGMWMSPNAMVRGQREHSKQTLHTQRKREQHFSLGMCSNGNLSLLCKLCAAFQLSKSTERDFEKGKLFLGRTSVSISKQEEISLSSPPALFLNESLRNRSG